MGGTVRPTHRNGGQGISPESVWSDPKVESAWKVATDCGFILKHQRRNSARLMFIAVRPRGQRLCWSSVQRH